MRSAPSARGGASSPQIASIISVGVTARPSRSSSIAENGALQRSAQVELGAVAPRLDRAEHGEAQPAFAALNSHFLNLRPNGKFYDQMIGPWPLTS